MINVRTRKTSGNDEERNSCRCLESKPGHPSTEVTALNSVRAKLSPPQSRNRRTWWMILLRMCRPPIPIANTM
jgi:hypothetical protein